MNIAFELSCLPLFVQTYWTGNKQVEYDMSNHLWATVCTPQLALPAQPAMGAKPGIYPYVSGGGRSRYQSPLFLASNVE
jgi:hypothetical protein